MFKQRKEEGENILKTEEDEDNPKKDPKKQRRYAIVGAGVGAFVALAFSANYFNIISFAVVGGICAYYYMG